MENIPENLQGSATCEAAAETVDAIEQAIAILEHPFCPGYHVGPLATQLKQRGGG
jgi:hypothetical protein